MSAGRHRLVDAIGAGMLPLTSQGEVRIIVAPRENTIRRLFETRATNSDLTPRIRLTSNDRLSQFSSRHAANAIAYRAAESLRVEQPGMSASTGRRRSIVASVIAGAIALFALARLTIDNTSDSWLTRVFTAEYAGLFDVFLPGLAVWRLPLPLGGSSNHFRTSVLRDIRAWDPYNVTEDADLGMRIARLGYRTAVIPSTTHE